MITNHTANMLALLYYGQEVVKQGEHRKSCGRVSTWHLAVSGGLINQATNQLTDTGIGVLREYCQKARQ